MNYKTEHIAQQIRTAREARNMSQRELSALSGLTQSHISQIERSTMEPGLSSLVDITRALDLEIILVPKKLLPAINNILYSVAVTNSTVTVEQRRLIGRLEQLMAEMNAQFFIASEAATLKDSLRLLNHLPLSPDELTRLKDITRELGHKRIAPPTPKELSEIVRSVRQLRNAVVHRDSGDEVPRSAYALDEEDGDA